MVKTGKFTRLFIDREGKITNIRGREIEPSAVRPIGESCSVDGSEVNSHYSSQVQLYELNEKGRENG